MVEAFDVCELVQVAISEKQKCVHFYNELSGFISDQVLRNVLTQLSDR